MSQLASVVLIPRIYYSLYKSFKTEEPENRIKDLEIDKSLNVTNFTFTGFIAFYSLANRYVDLLRELVLFESPYICGVKIMACLILSYVCNMIGDRMIFWLAVLGCFVLPLILQKRAKDGEVELSHSGSAIYQWMESKRV